MGSPWSKKRLETFVVLSIFMAIVVTSLRSFIISNYKTGALLIFVSSLAKMLVSYSNIQALDFKIRHVFLVASLSFIGTCLGTFSYYHKASCTSYATSSSIQYIFIALVSFAWSGTRYSFAQYFGLLIIMIGVFIEVSSVDAIYDIPMHTLTAMVSGVFNAASFVAFDLKVKPALENIKSFWSYMMAYTFYLATFSSLHLIEEIFSNAHSYVEALKSPMAYLAVLSEIIMAYVMSSVSLYLDSVERSTLVNVCTGASAIASDILLSYEIDAQKFLGVSLAMIGAQMFNFFWREENTVSV
ncbi:hypothetical protein CWI42_090620 [Ordospora colligata]|uniref:EamA domain-containing protein n=1 Tax=Ordospora colligata OC4 TaxID=1354746 RepID=A0A0B2UJA5_9MICR|nr:uncharacterized protein M896_090620 [Ordospora colligata OC4]KHN69137.1 hypothetical protein M896_090620 [Ordospora colligata OC4]TBU14592.1 hypothetical protein CWI41_090620 [Ordospora colligata]TBU18220.1 hypothetical protein CWI42_090620 [Ordospora colligata]